MRHELTFAYDYGQVYLYDAGVEPGDVIAALDDANAARLTVGVDGGLVDLLMPMQWNFDAPLVVELLDAAPALDLEGWEHVVEFPLALPTGRLRLEASGGGGTKDVPVTGSAYRARWSGRGFPAPGDYVPGDTQTDGYRIQLWPEEAVQAVVELRRWPGYDLLAGED